MSTTTPLSDEDLVTKVFRQHDPAAFAILYDRYFPQVFDQAYRVLRDTDRAADVAQDTFTKLLEVKEQHYPRTSFRAWLYTISRNRALDETRRAKRTQPLATVTTGDEPERVVEPASDEPGPERTVLDREVADLVWEAARGLRPEDYTLLDLSVRKGLSIEELAQVLHTSRGNVSTRLSRLRDAQEEAITALLLARRGRNECAILATLLPADSNSPLTPALRRQIIRHLESCATCQGVRKRYVSAVELLSGLAPILPPALLQDQLRAQLLGRLAAPAPTAANGHISSNGAAETASGEGAAAASSSPLAVVGQLGLLGPALLGLVGIAVVAVVILTRAHPTQVASPISTPVRPAVALPGLALTASVQLTNVNCGPIVVPSSTATQVVQRLGLLAIPSGTIAPGQSGTATLPPGQVQVALTGQQASVSGYGLTVSATIPANLVRVTWDGQDLLGTTTTLSVAPGSHHVAALVCQ